MIIFCSFYGTPRPISWPATRSALASTHAALASPKSQKGHRQY